MKKILALLFLAVFIRNQIDAIQNKKEACKCQFTDYSTCNKNVKERMNGDLQAIEHIPWLVRQVSDLIISSL